MIEQLLKNYAHALRTRDEALQQHERLQADLAVAIAERDALAMHVRPHRPSVDTIRRMHSMMTAAALEPSATAAEQVAGHRPYAQTGHEQCYLCALIATAEEAQGKHERAMTALREIAS